MSAVRDAFVFCGESGSPCYRVEAIVDTGSDRSVIPGQLARLLGLRAGGLEAVDTGGGMTPMYRSRAAIAPVNQGYRVVDVWVNDGGSNETTVGANALRALGYRLLPPEDEESGADTERSVETEELAPASYAATLPDPLAASRLAVCLSCSSRSSFLGVDTCSVCHCALALKTRIPSSSCPQGRW